MSIANQRYANWYNAAIDNPFHYGSAVTAERFTDRETELEVLCTCLMQGQNAILLSPRRYGKSSLLKRAVDEVGSRGARVGMANLIQCSNRREVAEELATAIARGPGGRIETRLDDLRRLLADLRPSLSVETHGIRVTLSPLRADSDWSEEIRASLHMLAKLRRGKAAVGLVIDEFQRVAEIDAGLPGLFKAMVDELERVSLVLAGSRRHLMEELTQGPGAPLLGIGQRISLGPIAQAEMTSFLVQRAASAGKELAAPVANAIYEAVHGVPNYVQQLAFWAFTEAGDIIDTASVERAMATSIGLSATDFAESYEKLALAQQRLLRALAREPTKDVYSRRFLDQVAVANPSSTRKALLRLEELELVALGPQGWRVANPFFERWLLLAGDLDSGPVGAEGEQ